MNRIDASGPHLREAKPSGSGMIFKSMVGKLLAFLIVLQLLIPAFVFMGIEFRAHQAQRAQLVKDGQELIDLQSTALQNALWEYNNDAIDDLLSIIAAQPYVQQAELKGLNGDLIATTDYNGPPKYPEYMISRDLSYAFSTGEEPVGKLSITLDDKVIIATLYERLSVNGLITLATQAFLILLTIIGVRRIISRPFERLSLGAAEWDYPDALGQFVQSHQVLRKEQIENERKISDYTEQLNIAYERLSDLKQRNEQALFSMDEKIAELERFTQLSVGREQHNHALKSHVNELLVELERPPAYAVAQFENRLEEDIALIETMNPAHKTVRFLNEATPRVLFQLEQQKALERFLLDVWRLAFVFIGPTGKRHFFRAGENLASYRFAPDLKNHEVTRHKQYNAGETHPAYTLTFREDGYADVCLALESLVEDANLPYAPENFPTLYIGGILLSSPSEESEEQDQENPNQENPNQETLGAQWIAEKQGWQFSEAGLKQLVAHVYGLLGFGLQHTVAQTSDRYMRDFMKAQYLAALSVAEESEATCQEITANKTHLDDLLAARSNDVEEITDLLQQTMSAISDGVFILDRDLCYTLYNTRYIEIFDVPENLIGVGRPFKDVIRFLGLEDIRGIEAMEHWAESHLSALSPDTLAAEPPDSSPVAQEEGPVSFVLHIGAERIIEVTQSPTREGGVMGVVIDITERMRAQLALEEAEQHSSLILNSAAEGIIGLDTGGRITFVNESACKFLLYGQEELIGASMHESIQHSDATGTRIPVDMSRVFITLRDGRTQNSANEVLWRKDGSFFAVEYSCKPIYKGDAIIGAVFTFQDITERLETQQIVQEKIDELEDFSLMAVGRELEMIDLKKEINQLRQKLGEAELYEIPE